MGMYETARMELCVDPNSKLGEYLMKYRDDQKLLECIFTQWLIDITGNDEHVRTNVNIFALTRMYGDYDDSGCDTHMTVSEWGVWIKLAWESSAKTHLPYHCLATLRRGKDYWWGWKDGYTHQKEDRPEWMFECEITRSDYWD